MRVSSRKRKHDLSARERPTQHDSTYCRPVFEKVPPTELRNLSHFLQFHGPTSKPRYSKTACGFRPGRENTTFQLANARPSMIPGYCRPVRKSFPKRIVRCISLSPVPRTDFKLQYSLAPCGFRSERAHASVQITKDGSSTIPRFCRPVFEKVPPKELRDLSLFLQFHGPTSKLQYSLAP